MHCTVGLIGLGNWGLKIYKTINKHFPKLRIICVAVKKGKNLDQINKNIKIYFDWKKMIIQNNPDYIFVALPPDNNYEIFKYILNKNINLFLEKPMTTNILKAKKMLEIYNKSRCIVHINHTDLYNNVIKKLLINSNSIKNIEFQITNSSKVKKYISPFEDLAPHPIAIALVFFKSFPKKILVSKLPILNKKKLKGKRQLIGLKLIFSNRRIANIVIGNGTTKKIRQGKFHYKNKIYFFRDKSKYPLSVRYKNSTKRPIKKILHEPSLASSIHFFLNRKKNKKFNDVKLALNIQKIISYSLKKLSVRNKN